MDSLRWRESWQSVIACTFKNDNRQTPASCSNVALHNLYPGEIDLLVCCRRRRPLTFNAIILPSAHLFISVIRSQFGEEHVL